MTTFIVLTLPNIGLVNRIPIWLTVLVISRDVGIVLTVAIVSLAIGPRTFKPSLLGKGATAFFIVTCVVVMYFNYLGTTSWVVDAFIWASLVITLASGSITCSASRGSSISRPPPAAAEGRLAPLGGRRTRFARAKAGLASLAREGLTSFGDDLPESSNVAC